MDIAAAQAFARFGLGRRGSEPTPPEPRAWLLVQLDGADHGVAGPLPTTAEALSALRSDRVNKPSRDERLVPKLWRRDAAALVDLALATDTPFRERLVWFWANHFTISTRQGPTRALAGAYVAEAIRPHVTGRFEDMVMAVMRHPAMLMYLENQGSVGPHSPVGLRRDRGLNENLARECMELHTVTPAAGYTQADVTSFAAILTGWSVDLAHPPVGFRFRPMAHEPGPKTLMGRVFPPGEQGGIEALAFLANHPSTHHALATKLARNFVADTPPPDGVRRIETALRDTGGDLGAASRELVALPAAWSNPGAKLRAPQDYVIAVLRAADLPADRRPANPMWPVFVMNGLGEPLFGAPLPNGFPDRAADWATPEGIMRRVDWSYDVAGRLGNADPMALADASLGPLLHPATRTAIAHAGSRRDAITLALSSPEFQRR